MLFWVVLILAAVAGALYYFQQLGKAAKQAAQADPEKKEDAAADAAAAPPANTIGPSDISHLSSKLHPASNHMDVLLAVATTPENIAYGLKAYQLKEATRRERIKEDLEEAKKSLSRGSSKEESTEMFSLDDDGWADDDADDEKAKAAAKAEEEKKKERERLQQAVGKAKIKLEGIDEGVIGQKWIENLMASRGLWPPKYMGFLKDQTFDYEGKQVSALDHPGLRRNLCMIHGRLHSILLNSHPELLEAGSKQMLDQTYFKGAVEFRGRCAMLLEASLRTAVACRNYPLAKTIVETVSMFKIGAPSPGMVDWFNGVMMKQYQTLPRLQIQNLSVECPDENDMATGDILSFGMELTRLHAEAFTRQKIAMFQKQGIPPQVALQSYREGWWFFLRAERLDGETPASTLELKKDGILRDVAPDDIAKFEKASFDDRLLTAWPMMINNVAQKSGKVKIQFLAPPVPGKYKFTVTVKSQDFLGADQDFSVEGTIVDSSTVVRTKKADKPTEGQVQEDPQAKKDN